LSAIGVPGEESPHNYAKLLCKIRIADSIGRCRVGTIKCIEIFKNALPAVKNDSPSIKNDLSAVKNDSPSAKNTLPAVINDTLALKTAKKAQRKSIRALLW
jgi:hypothetical protein